MAGRMVRSERRVRGGRERFRAFVQAIAAQCGGDTARCEAAIEAITAILAGRAHIPLPGVDTEEQTLYARALLANLLRSTNPDVGVTGIHAIARRLAPEAFRGASSGMFQNYVDDKGFYRGVFDQCAGLFARSLHDLRVAILGSGSLNYVNQIKHSFIELLRRSCPDWSPVIEHAGTTDGRLDNPAWQRSIEAIRRADQQGTIEYLVAVGTQAALILKLAFELSPQRQLLFLGVTDPIEARLIRAFEPPHDDHLSGVAYCAGAHPIIGRLRHIFPTRTLAFVYKQDVPQDFHLATELKQRYPSVRLIATEDFPSIQDLHDPAAVYFSWYTFDLMFEHAHPHSNEILQQRIVVTTTLANLRCNRWVTVAIGARDSQIGVEGAQMLLRARSRNESLRTEAVIVPPLEWRINYDAVKRLGLQASPDGSCLS